MNGRAVITHLSCLAVGLGLGIYLTKNNSPANVVEPVAVEEAKAVEARPSEVPSGASGPVTSGLPADDPALTQMRADYEEQVRKGEQRQALLILQEMEKKSPRSQTYLELHSDYQIYARDWAAAGAAARACVAAFPKNRTCYRNLATAELQEGSTDEQASAVDACLNLEPNDPQCRNMLGMVQMNGGDFAGAVATYEKLIRDNGSYGTRFGEDHLEWQLGLALEGAGRRSEAIDHLENACRRNMNQACQKIEELSGGGLN